MTRKEKFANALKANESKLEIAYKDESLFMRLLGYLLFFNKKFMTSFTTTIGNTMYFPSKKFLQNRSDWDAIITLAHEYQHVKDFNSNPFLFNLSYLFPICLLPLVVLAMVFLPWWLCVTLAVLCLTPLPSPWRKKAEIRGYSMSLFMYHKLCLENKKMPQSEREVSLRDLADKYGKHFTGMDYYLMWPFGVTDELQDVADAIISGDLEKSDVIYREVVDALEVSKAQ